MRLDKLLCVELPGCTRRKAKEMIAAGRVRVGGRRARKGVEVLPGQMVEVDEPDGRAAVPPAEPGTGVKVVYEDAALIAVDKPAGMPSHPTRPGQTGTVANFLVARYPELAAVGRPLEAGLVHRLDNETSGVMLAARTAASYSELRRQFSRHQVIKKYVALVRGVVERPATIDAPIEHVPGSGRRMRIAAPAAGRKAVTHYAPLRRVGGNTLLEVEMRTGVRHQIRVHLAAAGHPLAGDKLYDRQADAGGARHQLRAVSITFRHPLTGEAITITAGPSADASGVDSPALEPRSENGAAKIVQPRLTNSGGNRRPDAGRDHHQSRVRGRSRRSSPRRVRTGLS